MKLFFAGLGGFWDCDLCFHDLIDEAVVAGFFGGHKEVAVGIVPDLRDRLAGVVGEDLV